MSILPQAMAAVGCGALLLFSMKVAAETITYRYDALHRLVSVEYGDGTSIAYTYDPAGNILTTVRTSSLDSDGDGLTDQDEIDVYGTEPMRYDSDGDGLGDGTELGLADHDADPSTVTDPLLADTDGDGVLDGFNGNDPCEDCNNNGAVDTDESSPTSPEAFLAFVPGFNLFAYPSAVPTEHDDCRGLAAALGGFDGGIVSIARIDPTSGLFQRCGAGGGNDFPILAGEGYVIEADLDLKQVWPWEATCPTRALTPGVQLVGHPATPRNLTCFVWIEAQEPGLVSAIQGFSRRTNRVESCVIADTHGTGPQAAGMDFPIRAGQGYLIHANRSGPLLLPGCP